MPVALECREAAVRFLRRIHDERERVVLDAAGEMLAEYSRRLDPSGQPGVGDRFYREILRDWRPCTRVDLPKRSDGAYVDLPQAVVDAGFDPDDRKFAALAKREGVPVANAVDSDWLNGHGLLVANGIRVAFVCGCDPAHWRES